MSNCNAKIDEVYGDPFARCKGYTISKQQGYGQANRTFSQFRRF